MKTPNRFALLTRGLAAVMVVAAAVPERAGAQSRTQQPGPDTKRVMVSVFRGDVAGGLKLADELRDRVSSEFSIRQIQAVSKKLMDQTLKDGGFSPDSALSVSDNLILARQVRADEVIGGTVEKTASGYHVVASLSMAREEAPSQPLVSIESNNLGDVAKQIVSEYERARKQIPETQACENALRANTPAAAITAARRGIDVYAKATLARVCMATAYDASRTAAEPAGAWNDSVITITRQIIALDTASRAAWRLEYAAYLSKSDTANALRSLIGLVNADPGNATLREQVIRQVVQFGMPEIGIPFARKLAADFPGDPQYVKLLWQVLRAAKNYTESVPVGMELVKLDPSAADSGYFERQINAIASDSNYAKAVAFAIEGLAKFPRNVTFLLLKAQNERKAGQIAEAKKSLELALEIDPRAPNANMLLAQIAYDMGVIDDAIKGVKADAASTASNKERDSQYLLQLGGATYKAAGVSRKIEDYRKAMALLKAADEINTNVNAQFLSAVAAFSIVQEMMDGLATSRACEDFKAASELLSYVSITLPPTGRVNPEAAQQILGGIPKLQPFIDGSVRRFCR